MKGTKFLMIILTLAMVFSFTACGEGKEEADEGIAVISEEEQQEVIDKLAEEASEVPVPDVEAAASADAAAQENEAETASDEKLLGEWADINDISRFVIITKSGEQYEYEDVDGKYPGTYKDGILTIQISDAEGDTAKVFIDSKTGNMVTDYLGDIYEFSRKID